MQNLKTIGRLMQGQDEAKNQIFFELIVLIQFN
jgi:hypothetical protein